MITPAGQGQAGSEQDHYGKDYKKLHEVAFHGRSPASIEPVCQIRRGGDKKGLLALGVMDMRPSSRAKGMEPFSRD
jgi:hypothetical protein